MFCSDPSGNYGSYKGKATGKNKSNSESHMQDNYKEDMTLDEAMVLACDVLAKSMDSAKKDASRFEIGVVTKDSQGKLVQRKVEG